MTPSEQPTPSEQLMENPSLSRARLTCALGRDVLTGTTLPPYRLSRTECAMYHLLQAVDDIALALMKDKA